MRYVYSPRGRPNQNRRFSLMHETVLQRETHKSACSPWHATGIIYSGKVVVVSFGKPWLRLKARAFKHGWQYRTTETVKMQHRVASFAQEISGTASPIAICELGRNSTCHVRNFQPIFTIVQPATVHHAFECAHIHSYLQVTTEMHLSDRQWLDLATIDECTSTGSRTAWIVYPLINVA